MSGVSCAMPRMVGRRRFLGTALAAAGATGVLWWQYANVREQHVLRIGTWVAESPDATELGRVYLASQPEEASVNMLTRLLSADLDVSLFEMSDGELRQVSRARMRRDFEDGRTLTVQGWLFSRTELRLYGLAALLAES